MSRKDVARSALWQALATRMKNGVGPGKPMDVVDFASRLGVEVRYVDLASLEGMYLRGKYPTILLSAHRPTGRQAFTCAHELGHHVSSHGSKIDTQIAEGGVMSGNSLEELFANVFASFLLMPKSLVNYALSVRGWSSKDPSPLQVYSISNWLGVGYSTLIYQMDRTLGVLSRHAARVLLNFTPRQIRIREFGEIGNRNMVIADLCWKDRAIDLKTGDLAALPSGSSLEGTCVRLLDHSGSGDIVEAVAPGLGRAYAPAGWASYLRVSRSGYVGRSLFRHLEEPEHGN